MIKTGEFENKRMKIRVNKNLGDIKSGTTIAIRVDKDGVPKKKFWRNRFKDAKHDDCVEILKETKSKKKKEG
jgi:hypothetical protein